MDNTKYSYISCLTIFSLSSASLSRLMASRCFASAIRNLISHYYILWYYIYLVQANLCSCFQALVHGYPWEFGLNIEDFTFICLQYSIGICLSSAAISFLSQVDSFCSPAPDQLLLASYSCSVFINSALTVSCKNKTLSFVFYIY